MVVKTANTRSTPLRRAVAFAVSLLFGSLAHSQSPPSLNMENLHVADGSLRTRPAGVALLGSTRVELEKTTLQEVQDAIRGLTIRHVGDASESTFWLCYTLARHKYSQRVWVISDGEMGGANHLVTSILVSRLARTDSPNADCPQSPMGVGPATIGDNLVLGMSVLTLQKAFGATPRASEGWWSYRYQGTTPIQTNGKSATFDVTASVDVRLRRGKVIAIRIKQTTSN